MDRLALLGAGQASFFMLTPLPGSADYIKTMAQRRIVDADLNNYDTFHATHRHPRFAQGEWKQAYDNAWKKFYSFENMKRTLSMAHPSNYWGIFLNFIWYKNSFNVEGDHPMLTGFVRLKGRRERRPDYPLESRRAYFKRRFWDAVSTLKGWTKLMLEMEEIWLATRKRSPLEMRTVLEWAAWRKRAREWRSLRLSELKLLYQRAAQQMQKAERGADVRVPSSFELWLKKCNIFSDSLTYTRAPMKRFWIQSMRKIKRGRIAQVNYFRLVFNGIRESILMGRFLLSLFRCDGGASS